MDIERLAVCAVIDVIARTDYLFPLLGMKYGEPINFNNKRIPPIGHIAIANLNIILHFLESEDGKYKIENFADSIAYCKSDYADGDFFDTSKYTILREKDFMEFPIYRIWTGREKESIAQKY